MPPPASAFNTFLPDTPKAVGQPKLLDRVRAVAGLRHLSLRTEQAYSGSIRRFILSHLAVEGRVAASTQNVALCARRG